jgi:hypothetical protein
MLDDETIARISVDEAAEWNALHAIHNRKRPPMILMIINIPAYAASNLVRPILVATAHIGVPAETPSAT